MSSDKDRSAELDGLLNALCEERLSEPERQRLNELLREGEEARWRYLSEVHLHAALLHLSGLPTVRIQQEEKRSSRPTVVLGFLGDALRAGGEFLSRSFVLTLLLAIGLPLIVLTLLIIDVAHQPVGKAPVAPVAPAPPVPVAVAQVTDSLGCVLAESGADLPAGTKLFPDQRVQLKEGLAEVTFAGGAKAVLQGPATFDTTNGGAGFLRSGSLVATVPPKARGFTVRTPTAAVVDLGTEFGVSVDDSRGEEEVQVFRGEVVLETGPAHVDRAPTRRHLVAGSAASIVRGSGGSEPSVREIAFQADRYVRSLRAPAPAPVATPKPAIVADFSGGQGESAVDQYPGIAGGGWASGWSCTGMWSVSVARNDPVLGGGDYLRVLAERGSGTNLRRQAIQRQLDLDGPVSLKKPYVVSFSVRVDSLNLFEEKGERIVFSNNTVSRVKATKLQYSNGWQLFVAAQDDEQVKSRHWGFYAGDGKGNRTVIDSGIPFREGETYSFRILFDPGNLRWTPSIAVGSGPWTNFGVMDVRSTRTAEEAGYWPYFCVNWYWAGGNKGAEKERLGFSLDSIRIAAAEEGGK